MQVWTDHCVFDRGLASKKRPTEKPVIPTEIRLDGVKINYFHRQKISTNQMQNPRSMTKK